MFVTEDELQALTEERKRWAARVQTLLEQLEAAEKEFLAITAKVQAFRDPPIGTRPPRPGAPPPQPRSGDIR